MNKILILKNQGTLFQAPIQGQSSSLLFFLLILKKSNHQAKTQLDISKRHCASGVTLHLKLSCIILVAGLGNAQSKRFNWPTHTQLKS